MNHLSKWTLKSLTIGPHLHETSARFWEEALCGLPPLPTVNNVTIVYNYPMAGVNDADCWQYFDRMLTRQDLFPALGSVRVQESIGSSDYGHPRTLCHSLRKIRERGLLTCKSLTFERA